MNESGRENRQAKEKLGSSSLYMLLAPPRPAESFVKKKKKKKTAAEERGEGHKSMFHQPCGMINNFLFRQVRGEKGLGRNSVAGPIN